MVYRIILLVLTLFLNRSVASGEVEGFGALSEDEAEIVENLDLLQNIGLLEELDLIDTLSGENGVETEEEDEEEDDV